MDLDLLNAVSNLEKPDGVVAIPGDDCYYLCCQPDHLEAAERMQRIKGKPVPEPFTLLGCDIDAFRPYVQEIFPAALNIMEKYWPGPLIVKLPGNPTLPKLISNGQSEIGLMQPDSSQLLDLLSLLPGGILAVNPARRYDDPPCRSVIEVFNAFGDDVDYVVKADKPPHTGEPDARPTIVAVSPDGSVELLRSGRIVLD